MRRALVAVAATLVLATAACGVPLDSEPRAVSASTTTAPDPASSPTDAAGDTTAYLFFVVNNQLVNLAEEISERNVTEALMVLFEGVPPGTVEVVATQIPVGTRLLGVERTGSLLAVDVSAEFDNLVGTVRTQATAQIVMTATDLPGIDQVAFRIDGQPTQVFSPTRGDSDSVGPCDYVGLLPTEDPPDSWAIERKAERHLTTRRNRLLDLCPTEGEG